MVSAIEALNFSFYVIFINLNINMGAVKKKTHFFPLDTLYCLGKTTFHFSHCMAQILLFCGSHVSSCMHGSQYYT